MTVRPVTTKVNFLVKSKSDVESVSKFMRLVFAFFHVALGLDFGFIRFKSPTQKMFSKLLTFIQVSAIIAIHSHIFIFTNNQQSYSVWNFTDVLIYYFYAVLMLLCKNTYYDFQVDLNSFDREIEVDSNSYRVELKIILVFLFNLMIKGGLSISCYLFKDGFNALPYHFLFLYFTSLIGFDTVLIVNSFLFQSVYYRITKFASFVKNDTADVVSCHYLYKNIADITERTKKTFDLVFFLALVDSSMHVTSNIYLPFVEQTRQLASDPLSYALVAGRIFMLFSPAITAGLLASQVGVLKLALYDRLVNDQKSTKDIKRFISYIDARPLRFKVWKVIPLDWSLPVIVINIAVTYLIVIIQFTHN